MAVILMVHVVSYVEDTRKKCKGEAPDMLEAFSISDVGKKRQINQDCVDISTENDSFYCRLTKPIAVTKLAFATEELYLRSQKKS